MSTLAELYAALIAKKGGSYYDEFVAFCGRLNALVTESGLYYTATSTTQLTIGTGTKTLTLLEEARSMAPGVEVMIVDGGNAGNYMRGPVTSYSGNTLAVDSQVYEGSGTIANWEITVVPRGGVVGPASATDLAVAQWDGTSGGQLKVGPTIGTGANQLVQLTAAGKLPAVDGSLLTGTGGLVLIASASASNVAAVDFTAGIDGTYDRYVLTGSLITVQTDNVGLNLRVTQNGGSAWLAANYSYIVGSPQTGNAINTAHNASTTLMPMLVSGVGNAAGETCSFMAAFDRPSNTAVYKTFEFQATSFDNSGALQAHIGSGAYKGNTSAINGVRVIPDSGNIVSGEFHLYGMRKA